MPAQRIAQRQRQVLVHAFLYYELDASVVSDAQYGRWWRELSELQRAHPQIAEQSPYWTHCRWISDEDDTSYSFQGRGYTRKSYPDEIMLAAFRILAHIERKPVANIIRRYIPPKGGIKHPEPAAYPGRKLPQEGDRVVCTNIGIVGTIEYVDTEHVWRTREAVLCRDAYNPVQVLLDRPYNSGKLFEPDMTWWRGGMNEYTEEM